MIDGDIDYGSKGNESACALYGGDEIEIEIESACARDGDGRIGIESACALDIRIFYGPPDSSSQRGLVLKNKTIS